MSELVGQSKKEEREGKGSRLAVQDGGGDPKEIVGQKETRGGVVSGRGSRRGPNTLEGRGSGGGRLSQEGVVPVEDRLSR